MSAKSKHRDEALVLALASGASWRQAAKQSGYSQATVGRRMSEAGFRLLVSAKRAELLDSAAGQLTALMRSAASTLKLLLKSSSDAVRLGASKAILDAAISMKTVIELERRVLDLEHRP